MFQTLNKMSTKITDWKTPIKSPTKMFKKIIKTATSLFN